MDVQIIAEGGFNTGRLYTKDGQLIDWYQLSNDKLLFKDRSRMGHGFIDRTATTAEVLPAWLMSKYDNGHFDNHCADFPDYLAPRHLDRDYGPALKI